jgi:hypothetical protein
LIYFRAKTKKDAEMIDIYIVTKGEILKKRITKINQKNNKAQRVIPDLYHLKIGRHGIQKKRRVVFILQWFSFILLVQGKGEAKRFRNGQKQEKHKDKLFLTTSQDTLSY